jgi:putative transposase
MQCSMSRKGNPPRQNGWDNAFSKSFLNSLKNERVHGTRYSTQAEPQAGIFDCTEPFYKRKRLHSTLGFFLPANFLQR